MHVKFSEKLSLVLNGCPIIVLNLHFENVFVCFNFNTFHFYVNLDTADSTLATKTGNAKKEFVQW